MNICADEVLQYIGRHYKIDFDSMLSEMENKKRQDYLKQHPYTIWLASDNRFKSYLPDSSVKNGRRMIAKSDRKVLEDMIINYYHEQKYDKLKFQNFFYEWLEIKRLTVSNGSIERLHNLYKRFYQKHEINHKKVTTINYQYLKLFVLNTVKKYDMDYKQYSNFISVLRGILEYAVDLELIEKNPFSRFQIGRNTLRSPRVSDKKEQVFSLKERKLLEAAICHTSVRGSN